MKFDSSTLINASVLDPLRGFDVLSGVGAFDAHPERLVELAVERIAQQAKEIERLREVNAKVLASVESAPGSGLRKRLKAAQEALADVQRLREREEGYAALARLREAEEAIATRDNRRAKWKQQAETAIAERSAALDIADTLAALRTLAAQIARGDDRLGGDPTPSDAARFGSAADREVEQ